MEIRNENLQGVIVAEITAEELDASNAGELKSAMAPILGSHSKVVMDLNRMHFVDSSGLGAIISCLRQINARGGDLKLCCMTGQVRTAFELVRMHRVFDILETREDAVQAFGTGHGGKI